MSACGCCCSHVVSSCLLLLSFTIHAAGPSQSMRFPRASMRSAPTGRACVSSLRLSILYRFAHTAAGISSTPSRASTSPTRAPAAQPTGRRSSALTTRGPSCFELPPRPTGVARVDCFAYSMPKELTSLCQIRSGLSLALASMAFTAGARAPQ
eukprot:3933908-Pleurochrysis_carterae.AAC.1